LYGQRALQLASIKASCSVLPKARALDNAAASGAL